MPGKRSRMVDHLIGWGNHQILVNTFIQDQTDFIFIMALSMQRKKIIDSDLLIGHKKCTLVGY